MGPQGDEERGLRVGVVGRILALVVLVATVMVAVPAEPVEAYDHLSPGCEYLDALGDQDWLFEYVGDGTSGSWFRAGEVVTVEHLTFTGTSFVGSLSIANASGLFDNPLLTTATVPSTLTYRFDGTETGAWISARDLQLFHGGSFHVNCDAQSVAVGLEAPAGYGWTERMTPDPPFGPQHWDLLNWSTYNAANGETRPALCDVDGDDNTDLVVGLGPYPSDGGWVYIELAWGGRTWRQVPWSSYNAYNGETWPACGDVDADGRDEIAVGLGPGGFGYVYLMDDWTTGYAPMPGTPIAGGWLHSNWASYNAANGTTRPAIGNLDADPFEEIVVGLGEGGGAAGGDGWMQLFNGSNEAFAPMAGTPTSGGWLQVQWGAYAATGGGVHPAVCNLGGTPHGHVVAGLDDAGLGWVQVFDANTGFGPAAGTPTPGGWLWAGWTAYIADADTSTYPACGNLDGDAAAELVVGFAGPVAAGWLSSHDDLNAGLARTGWPRVHWTDYNNALGSTRPAVR